jgi:hypothetical protein
VLSRNTVRVMEIARDILALKLLFFFLIIL